MAGKKRSKSHGANPVPTKAIEKSIPSVNRITRGYSTVNNISFVKIYDIAISSGKQNFCGARVPVPSKLNINNFRCHLQNYHDKQIVDFLQFGWPINYCGLNSPKTTSRNHRSASNYASVVDKDIAKDLADGSIVGPFDVNPLKTELVISPLQTVHKDDISDSKRVVVDLSFPPGESVNDGIPGDTFMGMPFVLRYPSVDDLARIVREKGRGCLLFKRDLRRAYKQLPISPNDWGFCGIKWRDNLYIYVSEIFGLRSSAMACQRTTNSVMYMYKEAGYHCCNYLDDFGGCESPKKAKLAFETLGLLLTALGLKENLDKAIEPTTQMIFLGILLNTLDFTLTIPPNKLWQIRQLLEEWIQKSVCTLKELVIVGLTATYCELCEAGTCLSQPHVKHASCVEQCIKNSAMP